MAALIDAIDIKRKMYFEFENAPYYCMDVEVLDADRPRRPDPRPPQDAQPAHPRAVFDKTFKGRREVQRARTSKPSKSPISTPDGDGSHFMDQESFETIDLAEDKIGNALDYLIEGALLQLDKFNGNPIGLQLPEKVELTVTYTEPAVRGDTSRGDVTKPAKLETGIEIKVPFFIKEGEKVRVFTETGEFAGRA